MVVFYRRSKNIVKYNNRNKMGFDLPRLIYISIREKVLRNFAEWYLFETSLARVQYLIVYYQFIR